MEIKFLYNEGAITRLAFVDNYGRVHNSVWRLRQVLSADAVLLVGWADAQIEKTERGDAWIPRVDDIQSTFGWDDKQWRRVRKELEGIGCITSKHKKDLKSCKSVHTLNIDLTVLQALVPEPPARNGGSRARPAKSGDSRESPEKGGSRESPEVADPTTTREPEQKNHHRSSGGGGDQGQGQEQEQHGRHGGPFGGAVAPAGAGVGLGGLLADILKPAEAARVDAESAGASREQLQWAGAAFRAMLAAGKVRSVPGLAMRLARLATRGEVTPPAPPAGAAASGSGGAPPDPWPARAALAGSWLDHEGAALVVEPGGKSWRRRGGNLVVGGADALRLWERVEAGELALHP